MKKTAKSKKVADALPPGWSDAELRKLVAHYESQSEDEAVAEDQAAFAHEHTSMIEVPDRLVPVVRELVVKSG